MKVECVWEHPFGCVLGLEPPSQTRCAGLSSRITAVGPRCRCQWGREGRLQCAHGLRAFPFIIIYHPKGAQGNTRQSNTMKEGGILNSMPQSCFSKLILRCLIPKKGR